MIVFYLTDFQNSVTFINDYNSKTFTESDIPSLVFLHLP